MTNKLILNLLKKKVENAKGKWVDVLPSVLWALRTTPSSATRKTHFSLSHGSKAVLPIELNVPTQRVKIASVHEDQPLYFNTQNQEGFFDSLDLLEELRSDAALRQEEVKWRVESCYNSQIKEKSFCPGELVLRKVDAAARHSHLGKLAATWEGPFIVQERVNIRSYQLQNYKGELIPKT